MVELPVRPVPARFHPVVTCGFNSGLDGVEWWSFRPGRPRPASVSSRERKLPSALSPELCDAPQRRGQHHCSFHTGRDHGGGARAGGLKLNVFSLRPFGQQLLPVA
jgi:hypothetical protein